MRYDSGRRKLELGSALLRKYKPKSSTRYFARNVNPLDSDLEMQQYHRNKRSRRSTKHPNFFNENTNSHDFGVGDNATQLFGTDAHYLTFWWRSAAMTAALL